MSDSISGEIRFVIFHRPGPAWDTARAPTEQEGVAEHFAYVAQLVERAIVTMGGPLLTPMAGGMMITRPGLDEETLRSIVEGDPAVQSGLIRGEVHPWLITVDAGTREVS